MRRDIMQAMPPLVLSSAPVSSLDDNYNKLIDFCQHEITRALIGNTLFWYTRYIKSRRIAETRPCRMLAARSSVIHA